MGTITRGTKAAGGTDFSDNTDALASEVNTDFNTAYSEFNGNIDDNNIKAAADIDPSKIGDYSTNAAEQQTATSPGDTETPTLATDLETELEQLRYKLEEVVGRVDATRVNSGGTTTASWTEPPVRGNNLLYNADGRSLKADGELDGWLEFGTVSSNSQSTAFGRTRGLEFVTGAVDSGLEQRITDLKPSTKYLVIMRGRVANAAHTLSLITTGADATSGYRNISIGINSTSFTIVGGIIQTDSTPTDVVVQASGDTSGQTYRVNYIGVFELGTDNIPEPASSYPVIRDRVTATQALTTSWVDVSGLSLGTFSTTGRLDVVAEIPIVFSGAGRAYARMDFVDVVGSGGTVNSDPIGVTGDSGDVQTIVVHYSHTFPTVDEVQAWNVGVEVIASGAIGTVNGTADTLTLASNLRVYQVLP